MSWPTLTTARDLGRLQEIVAVLVRHGLGDLAHRLGWSEALAQAGRAVHAERAAELVRLEPPQQLRRALEELGPTFVKLGQVLAGRADLLGPEWTLELEKLHAHAPASPWPAVQAQLVEDLGGPPETVFAHFDPEPLAAASIAQVHAATLPDGREVVVKVRRPDIVPAIEADLRLLERLAAMAQRAWPELRPYQPVRLVQRFGRSLRRELDLAHEARNAQRIAAAFADDPEVFIPRIHEAWTRERLNVQDRVQGVPGEDLAALDAQGFNRHLLAERGARAVLKMVIEDGLFHADPHPGNLFYLPGHRLAFIDFGMVGTLAPARRGQLLSLLLGLVQREPEAVAEVLTDWTEGAGGEADLDELHEDLRAFVDDYRGVPLARLNLGAMLSDATAILRTHRLTLPPDLALLIKTFITLEGLGRGLDPDFEMATQAQPLLEAALRAQARPAALARRGWQTVREAANVLSGLPQDAMRLLRAARRGRIHLEIDVLRLERVADQLDRAASRITVGVVVAALIIGSSIVMNVGGGPTLLGLPAFGLLGFLGACGGAAWLLWSVARSGHSAERDDEAR